MFEGTVIARRGSGVAETFTVRRLSYGVGVERVFPLHSPNVVDVKVVHAQVKLFAKGATRVELGEVVGREAATPH